MLRHWARSRNRPTGHGREHEKSLLYFGCDFSGWYNFGKNIKTAATGRCHILRIKCTKFDFDCCSAPDPAGGAWYIIRIILGPLCRFGPLGPPALPGLPMASYATAQAPGLWPWDRMRRSSIKDAHTEGVVSKLDKCVHGEGVFKLQRTSTNYTVSQKKHDTKLLHVTSPNVNRFSQFFSFQTQQ